jgi:Protein of unknown function (DUF3999)
MKCFLTSVTSIILFYACQSVLADETAIPVYEINSQETFIQAPIDHEIYFYSKDSELGDLQVRDGQGNNLPFRVLKTGAQSQSLKRETPAIFFPVAPNTSEETLRTLSSTSIHINTDKVQVEVIESTANPQVGSPVEKPEFYLIDLTGFQKKSTQDSGLKLDALRMQFNSDHADSSPYQTWELSASNDLHNWSLLTSTSLVQLHKEGHSLIQDKIPLNITYQDYAYLKLRCVESCATTELSNLVIVEQSTTQFFPADTQWKLKGKVSSAKAVKLNANDRWQSSAAWDFVRDDVAGIETFSINLGLQTYGEKIRLLGRVRSNDAWQLLYEGIWFNTKVGSQWYTSAPQALYEHQNKEFRLEFASALPNDVAPELVFYTPSRVIQFVGNQIPPYQLLVANSGNSVAQARILDSLLKNQSPQWINHQWEFLNPPKPETSVQLSWRSLVFWGLVIIAVLLLALMAIKLFKQMNMKAD